MLTTNLKCIKNYKQRKKLVKFLGKEVVYEAALYFWLERLRPKKKKKMNMKDELAFKTKRGIY